MISMYHIQELLQPIGAHESYGMCHETPPVLSCIFKLLFSRYLLLVNPVNLLALGTVSKKSNHQQRLHKNNQEFCLEIPMKLANVIILNNVLSMQQADYYWVMAKKSPTINFMVIQFFMMLLLVLFGLRIKSLLELEKL